MAVPKVLLLGKEYVDVLLTVPYVTAGDTNLCETRETALGGVYNITPALEGEILYTIETSGQKDAYIVNDLQESERTAYVVDRTPSVTSFDDLQRYNAYDWVHIAYVDDFEGAEQLLSLNSPYSLDFCTTNNRLPYRDIIDKAAIVFDSRERKHLYSSLGTSTFFVFHDEYGVEVVKNKNILFNVSMTPIRGLKVNGAGDLFAGYFIKNNFNLDIMESAAAAMRQTTEHLQKAQNGAQE